ncbi:DHHA1 domain-containing protein, partial [Leptospira sp. SA-E8]|uniref:DHHA1 domain-containing protein n=1 Tax=Leptospira sp. SA-E8 TaxID=3422259 RepID=UPI003EBA1702
AEFMARGEAMDAKFRKLAEDMAANAEPILFNGIKGLMLNAPGAFHSLLGEILSRRSGTFALLWTANKGGVVKIGLRSQKGFDCIPLAESMGGGGHAQACGFRMKAERLPGLLAGVLNA